MIRGWEESRSEFLYMSIYSLIFFVKDKGLSYFVNLTFVRIFVSVLLGKWLSSPHKYDLIQGIMNIGLSDCSWILLFLIRFILELYSL